MAKKKILIIDDDFDFQNILKLHLKNKNYEILTAESGLVGLKIINEENPNLIIIDYEMPKMNGLKFLEKLDAQGVHTPVIWISGASSPDIFKEAWHYGIYEFFQKPIDFENLKACVNSVFEDFTEKDPGLNKMISFKLPLKTYEKLQKYLEKKKTTAQSLLEDYIKKLTK